MKHFYTVTRHDYSCTIDLRDPRKTARLLDEEINGFHDIPTSVVGTYDLLDAAESAARRFADENPFDIIGKTASWCMFFVDVVDEDGDLVDTFGGYGTTAAQIVRHIENRAIFLSRAEDFCTAYASEDEPYGLEIAESPDYANGHWTVEAVGDFCRYELSLAKNGTIACRKI